MNYLHKEDLHNWLWEAFVIEEQCEVLFDGQADQLREYPDLQAKLEHEAMCARTHQKILSTRLRQLEFNTAIFQDNFEGLINVSPTLFKMCMSNNAEEGLIALFTLTQMEITSFKTIEKAAEILNDNETREMSQTISERLIVRARWIAASITELSQGVSRPQAA